MSSTVAVGGFEITSNHASAEDMVEALTPTKDDSPQPRAITDKGKPVEAEPEKEGLSKAASELGKEGGKAAAAKRAADAKEAAKAGKKAKETPDDLPPVERDRTADETEEEKAAKIAEAEGKDKAGNPRKDPEARIAQVVRERNEAREELARTRAESERRARELEERLQRAERGERPAEERAARPGAQPGAKAGQADEDPEPQEGEYEKYSDWVRAHGAWSRREGIREVQRTQRAHEAGARAAAELDSFLGGWGKVLADTAKADATFTETAKAVTDQLGYPTRVLRVMRDAGQLPPGFQPTAKNWLADDLMSAPDLAPARLRYLSEHPSEIQRLLTLRTPRDVTREMGRLDAGLEAVTAGTRSRPEVSKAKPPVTPVTGSPHTDDPDESEMSFDQLARRRGFKKAN